LALPAPCLERYLLEGALFEAKLRRIYTLFAAEAAFALPQY